MANIWLPQMTSRSSKYEFRHILTFGGQTWPSQCKISNAVIHWFSVNQSIEILSPTSSVQFIFKIRGRWNPHWGIFLVLSGVRGIWEVRRYLKGKVGLAMLTEGEIRVVEPRFPWSLFTIFRSLPGPLRVPGQWPQLWPLWHPVEHQRRQPWLGQHRGSHCQES